MDKVICNNGNIPIDDNLFNKYKNVREIFDNVMFEHNNCIVINKQLVELKDKELNNMKVKDLKELAYIIFKKYNSKSIFENDENRIIVSKRGITESIEKIFNSREQRYLLKEHLQVFSDLGDIIEHATLVNQTRETKNRKNINSWNYYFNSLNIDGELYYLEFDVRSLDSGENQYRVQKLQKKTDYSLWGR